MASVLILLYYRQLRFRDAASSSAKEECWAYGGDLLVIGIIRYESARIMGSKTLLSATLQQLRSSSGGYLLLRTRHPLKEQATSAHILELPPSTTRHQWRCLARRHARRIRGSLDHRPDLARASPILRSGHEREGQSLREQARLRWGRRLGPKGEDGLRGRCDDMGRLR